MRKIAQEVDQGDLGADARVARHHQGRAEHDPASRSQVRKATAEQAKSAAEIAQATESMRRGAAATTRAVAEQAQAADEIARAAEGLNRQVASVSKAMAEQTTAATEITKASESMRQQAEQAAKALKEQSRAMKDMTSASANTANQIKQITRTNRDHSVSAAAVVTELAELRRVTDRNASGVKQARTTTADLLRYAEALTSVVDDLQRPNGSNRRASRTNGH